MKKIIAIIFSFLIFFVFPGVAAAEGDSDMADLPVIKIDSETTHNPPGSLNEQILSADEEASSADEVASSADEEASSADEEASSADEVASSSDQQTQSEEQVTPVEPEFDLTVKSTKMTIMIYLCGSDLEEKCASGTMDIFEMCGSGFSEEDMNIILMAGGSRQWYLDSSIGQSTGIYRVYPFGLATLWNDGKALNMGAPETLKEFLDFTVEEFPAEHYALILWDHGSGSLGGICHDMNFGGKSRSMHELESALQQSPFGTQKLDWIGFDACLMSAAETAAVVSPYATTMVASEESEPAAGWDYSFLGMIHPDESPAETGTDIVECYYASCNRLAEEQGRPVGNPTMACVDLNKLDDISQSIGDFFSSIEISSEEYAAISRARRELYSFGSGAALDLVDLGSVIDSLSSIAGQDETEMAAEALKECVVYSLPENREFTGLTVYFPFFNKGMARSWIENYQDLCFSDGYLSFVNQFSTFLLQNTEPTWGQLSDTNMSIKKDRRTIINLALTEQQLAEFGEAKLIAFQKDPNGEGWHIVALQDAVLTQQGRLNGQYVHTNLFVVGADGQPLIEVPFLYTENSDGSFSIPVTLTRNDGEETPAKLICRTQSDGGQISVESVFLYDDVIQGYSSRLAITREELVSQYQTAVYEAENRSPVFYSEDGTGPLRPFEEWTSEQNTAYSWDLNDSWEIAFVRDHLDTSTLTVAFQITDIFNNVYLSSPVSVADDGSQPGEDQSVYFLEYDDSDLLLISEEDFTLDEKGRLFLPVTNITDSEKSVTLSHFAVNGRETETEKRISGTGEHEGLQSKEQQVLFYQVPVQDGETVQELMFDLIVTEPDGTQAGLVTVRIHS